MFRGLLSAASIGLAIVITTFAVGTTTAAAVGGVSEDAFSSPRGMVLRGTHGYAIIVNTHPRSRGRRPEVVVSADDKRSLVRYAAPANLAGEGIHANLGRFGRINLRWVPDGRVGEIRFGCHGHGPHRRALFDRGAYEGTLRFRGGNGFTAVRVHRVAWRPSWYRGASTCRREGGESTPGPGKILQADIGHRDPSVSFVVYQPKSGTPVEYEAYDREAVGRVEIERTIWTSGRPRTLSSSSDFAAATVEPPAPFEGSAYFARTSGALGSWLGDLTVDFPDVSDVPMAGVRFATTFYSGSFEGGAR